MDNKTIKIAIIGIGNWGKVLLKEFILQAEVKYECDSKTDLDKVFNDSEINAIVIATPTETHFELAQQALEAGKHVFLEKPGCTNSADLEKLVRLAKGKNLKFAVGYEFPHHPSARRIKELIWNKKIKSLRLDYQKWGTFKNDTATNLLCHDISILKYWGVNNLTPIIDRTKSITNNDTLVTDFGNNIVSTINCTRPIKQRTVTLILENGGYIWSNDDLFEIDGENMKKIELSEVKSVSVEISDFLSAIKENKEPLTNGEFALEVYKIIESAQV